MNALRVFGMLTISAAGAIAQAEEPPLAIAIHVYNYAKLDAGALALSRQQAQRVYRHAGIETEWVDCPLKPDEADLYPACSLPPGGTRFALRILSPEMEEAIPKTAFGRTWFPEDGGPGYLAAVCPGRAKRLAGQTNGSYPLLLGHLIAHELGHLLLGTGSHAKTGIMHVPWYPAELKLIQRGSLYFNTSQATTIQEEVRKRTRKQVLGRSDRPVQSGAVVLNSPLQTIDPSGDRPLRLGIRVYIIARVPRATLRRTEEKVSAIFRRIGIDSVWANCPSNPEEPAKQEVCDASGPEVLTVKVVPESAAAVYSGNKYALGFALLSETGGPAGDAWVFFDRVVEQADIGGCYLPTALAYAIAHEIGHLLLGKRGHASSGIMKAYWNRQELQAAEMGRLRFSKRERQKMREQVMKRLGLKIEALKVR